MEPQNHELKHIASQVLAGMLSNPHIYPQVSDEGGSGQMEQKLVIVAVEMAKSLIHHVEGIQNQSES